MNRSVRVLAARHAENPGGWRIATVIATFLLTGCNAIFSVPEDYEPWRPPPADSTISLPLARPAVAAAPLADAPQVLTAYSTQVVYTVNPGDTINQIAARYRVSPQAIEAMNGLQAPYELSLGQRLMLPAVAPPGSSVVSTPAVPALSLVSPTTAVLGTTVATALPPVQTIASDNLPVGGTQTTLETPSTASVEGPDSSLANRPGPIPADPAAGPGPAPAPSRPPTEGLFIWPVEGPIVSGYGPSEDGLRNEGINISADRGTTIRAAQSGTVAYAGNELRGYGNLVLIRHDDGWVTAYAHADSIMVQRGQEVQAGQPIGTVGDTGSVTTPQLHFEIRQGSDAIDPMSRLSPL